MIEIKIDSLVCGPTKIIEGFQVDCAARTLLVTGPIGCGKTLLARALCGDFEESNWIKVAGEVTLGKATFGLPGRPKGASDEPQRIGYLPQNPTAFFVSSSVQGEILVSQYCSAKTALDAANGFLKWTADSPLSEKSDLPPLALSGGQQRLFMLEAVLGTSPLHLIVDGGMIALDKEFRHRATNLLRCWLDEDPQRKFICFGSSVEATWFEFDAVASLGGQQSTFETAVLPTPPQLPKKQILLFDSISAGPLISGRRLLENVTLRIDQGQFVALRGRNGIGKSTLLRLVAGITRPAKGDIYFEGERLRTIQWPGLRGGIGYLPQEPELAGPSVLAQAPRDSSGPDASDWEMWKQFFALDWQGDATAYWSMSSGQRARASLMFQAVYRPQLWILDEPTSRIDADEATAFLKNVRESNPRASAIIVSHDDVFLTRATDSQYELLGDGVRTIS